MVDVRDALTEELKRVAARLVPRERKQSNDLSWTGAPKTTAADYWIQIIGGVLTAALRVAFLMIGVSWYDLTSGIVVLSIGLGQLVVFIPSFVRWKEAQ